jgi:hypothetical protein
MRNCRLVDECDLSAPTRHPLDDGLATLLQSASEPFGVSAVAHVTDSEALELPHGHAAASRTDPRPGSVELPIDFGSAEILGGSDRVVLEVVHELDAGSQAFLVDVAMECIAGHTPDLVADECKARGVTDELRPRAL